MYIYFMLYHFQTLKHYQDKISINLTDRPCYCSQQSAGGRLFCRENEGEGIATTISNTNTKSHGSPWSYGSAQHWRKQAACDNRSWVDGETVKVTNAMTDTTGCHIHPEHGHMSTGTHMHTIASQAHTPLHVKIDEIHKYQCSSATKISNSLAPFSQACNL